ncbi:MAG: beta-lactamase family protein [Hyphomicrobiales bacterium]|nr:beta-lactamase family protein [Hyphomicrobiales bacterium]
MRRRNIAIGIGAALALAGGGFFASLDRETRGILMYLPTNADVLTWSQPQRDAAFRALDRLPFLAKAREIAPSSNPTPLPAGKPLNVPGLDDYLKSQHASALIILQDGKVRLERYALDFDAKGRWTSFSVAKSFTSTLVGAALQDGFIKSLDDKVSEYVTGLKGSAYDDVTVRQLLTMSPA